MIFDAHQRATVGRRLHAHLDLAARQRGLRGVAHQVHHHLRDLAPMQKAERPRQELQAHLARLDLGVEACLLAQRCPLWKVSTTNPLR